MDIKGSVKIMNKNKLFWCEMGSSGTGEYKPSLPSQKEIIDTLEKLLQVPCQDQAFNNICKALIILKEKHNIN